MKQLPEPWHTTYETRRGEIQRRLQDFAEVPSESYFYELLYCILTPQSTARNADLAIGELIRDQFRERGFDPTSYLRDPAHYIRFHNVKAKRLLLAREKFDELELLLLGHSTPPVQLRDSVLDQVQGLGMKEASHFLRNIGVRGLAILDRHVYKHLARLGVIERVPPSGPSRRRYLEIEVAWHEYSGLVGLPLDELDLLFWSMETGEIRK